MRKGFTLLELMVSIFAGLLIVGVMLAFYISYNNSWDNQFAKKEINNNFLLISERISAQVISNNAQVGALPEIFSALPYADSISYEMPLPGLVSLSVTVKDQATPTPNIYTYQHYFKIRNF
jgi:hypothetical protein